MSAQIYSVPEELGKAPSFDIDDIQSSLDREQEWFDQIAAWCKENGAGDLAGEHVRWQIGDGYANYVVLNTKPLALIWIDSGDAWRMSEIFERGLRTSDVRVQVDRQRTLKQLFGRRS